MTIKMVVKKDLKQIFPKEFTNRQLISKFIDYIMNHFFQTATEEYINGYIGKKTVALEEGDFYIQEPTQERQAYQLSPALVSTDLETLETSTVVDYSNFINALKLQGCNINDQNRLLSDDYWSWCPPINIDMFLNYNFYYWMEEGPEAIKIIGKTNAIMDILGKESYTYKNDYTGENIEFISGMRIILSNDENNEYTDKEFIVEGVGKSIEFIDDSEHLSITDISPDYFVMERGAIDGNIWSKRNRWFHKSAINNSQLVDKNSFKQAKKPIICFNKDIQLFNYGTTSRGMIDLLLPLKKSDINGSSVQKIQDVILQDGMTVLLTGDDIANNKPYEIFGISTIGSIILQPLINGSSLDGSAVKGEGVYIKQGLYANTYYYFDGFNWKLGQQKNNINQSPLFELYDNNKNSFDNVLYYPQSSFKGNKLFDYVSANDVNAIVDEDLGRSILTIEYGNYKFTNSLDADTFTYKDYDTNKEYNGTKFFKLNGEDTYLNTWYLANSNTSQYITTEIIVDEITYVDDNLNYAIFELAYQPELVKNKRDSFVYLNGNLLDNSEYFIKDKKLHIANSSEIKKGDNLYIKLMVLKNDDTLVDNYFYDLPLSLTANAKNENVSDITFNECFDQLKSIIENQNNFEGNSAGYNNYNNTLKNLSLGTEILQHSSPILKTMLLNSQQYTNVRNVFKYINNEYSKFKNKFRNTIKNMSVCGEYNETDDTTLIVKTALEKINIGKEGLKPFYNNGVALSLGECYIPATPAYLGLDVCYKPEIITVEENGNDNNVLLCHDGSYTVLFNDYRDATLLKLEEMIYESIPSKWKSTKPVFNKYKEIPGKFRTTDYSLTEYREMISPFLGGWCNTNNVSYYDNTEFDFTNPFTWNYSNCVDVEDNQLYGSYRAIYMYYYDTYNPHTAPWEMLGFGQEPDWWELHYGKAPYTSLNMAMWKDIENGHIVDGECEGYYEEFKRPGLVDKYLPVNDKGELLNPMQAGIVKTAPISYYASKQWSAGDIGLMEAIWMHTSDYRFDLQLVMYLMHPTVWIEHNWDTLNRETLFENTDYSQVIYSDTNDRQIPSEVYIHNELVDNEYIRKIGVQQWFADYLTYENINITNYLGSVLRNIDVKLIYKCGRYFKKDSLKLISDNYGLIPTQNYQLNLYKTRTNHLATYSAMVITKTGDGYMVDGFDKSSPYFPVLTPILTGKKTAIEINGKGVIYYNNWKKTGTDYIQKVDYKTEYKSAQDLFNVICGYGKYLEEVEGWVFNKALASTGTMIDYNSNAEDFIRWTSANPSTGTFILLNPGYKGMVLEHTGFLDIVGQYINGYWTVTDSNGNPLYNSELEVYRHNGYTDITTKDKAITMLKVNTIEHEHIIILDNKTIYGDLLYDPLLCVKTKRLKLIGTGVYGWDGTLYAPGYLVESDGAVPNYDKLVDDFRYFFDTDDIKAQSIFGDYAKETIGYKKSSSMERLLIDDRNMFDFYKGVLKEKGTRKSFGKLNRSNYIMGNIDSKIELYENWAFKVANFGYVSDNYLMEFKIDASKITQDPQIVSFTTNSVKENKNSIIEINLDDDNWIKRLSTKEDNTFVFSDKNRIYPTGGFAQLSDVNYLVADADAFNEIQNDIKIGETVWVVKKPSKDWDIFKRVEAGFQSMRVSDIDELMAFNETNPDVLEKDDLIYVTSDILKNHLEDFSDPDNLMYKGQNIIDKSVWSIFKYNGEGFDLYRIQNKIPDMKKINSCYLVNDDTNETLTKVNLYDPLQGIFPDNVMNEIDYATAFDPVLDYNDFYKWGDTKIGYLWWDISKVRYLDYHQGDIYYRRNNWGKQLPGSEIAIYEWTKSTTKPEDVLKYVEKELYNYETSTHETYYYYWNKNPSDIPDVDFRHKSALTISQTINSPQDMGIIWVAPIYIGTGDYAYSAFILGNYDDVSTGSDFVVQFNFKNAIDLTEHTEWVLIKEGDDDEIPTNLWNKMKASLIGYDTLGQCVPDLNLDERNKVGISIRPRQTMFKDMENSRRNFVDVVNKIFDTRDISSGTDVGTDLFKSIFQDFDSYPEYDYEPFKTHNDMQMVEDKDLIGKKLLVLQDENYGDIWTLWKMEAVGKFTLLKYQTYDVRNYWTYKDLYNDKNIINSQPLKTFSSEIDLITYAKNNILSTGSIFKVYDKDGKWELEEYISNQADTPIFNKIGAEDGTINLTSNIYDFLNDETLINDKEIYIGNLSKYEYLTNEARIVLEKIISYFE